MKTINDIELIQTCRAMPEQYDAYIGSVQVGYLRLRHGWFYVTFPDVQGKTIFEGEPNGDGEFDDDERDRFLTLAKQAIINEIKEVQPNLLNND